MNTLHRDGKLHIAVYVDHAPPHFHVRTPEGESLVHISSLAEQRGGKANRKLLAKAITWALTHRDVIGTEWNRLNPEIPYDRR